MSSLAVYLSAGYTASQRQMGFFFRKSASLGPFRLNFSKTGVGASVGVPGARLTMTPRGTTYITVGKHGFYYRETLSDGGRSGVPPSATPTFTPPPESPSSEIKTAEASDLVDSSSETLIKRLNERARMFNPAWLLYALGLGTGLLAFSPLASQRAFYFPDISSLSSPDRTGLNADEYTAVVAQYGYPSSVVAEDGFGKVPVRTANYNRAQISILFVPNGCVSIYQEVTKIAAGDHDPASRLRLMRGITPCVSRPDDSWTIAGYASRFTTESISADMARMRMDDVSFKDPLPPPIETKKAEGNRTKAPKSPPKLSSGKESHQQQAWSVSDEGRLRTLSAETSSSENLRLMMFGGLGVLILLIGALVHRRNASKRITRLFYELDEAQQTKYGVVQEALGHLQRSHKVWRIEARSPTSDWKRNAGASTLIRRTQITIGASYPARVASNVRFTCIDIGMSRLYFLPDTILFWRQGVFGGIGYEDFRVEQHPTRYIEDEYPPSDATIVDRTWRFVNKNGGPDRRFNNNAQLPVMQYGAVDLSSSRGLNILLNVSNLQESVAFAVDWGKLRLAAHGASAGNGPSSARIPAEAAASHGDACRLLGVSSNASPSEIATAYRRLVQQYHPDKVASLAPEFQVLADKRTKEINAAYETLKKAGGGIPDSQ